MRVEPKKQDSIEMELNHTVQGMQFGMPFRFCSISQSGKKRMYSNDIHLRAKPVNFLLNSNLINDVINRHKCFVVNVTKGTLFIVEGDRFVDPVQAVIQEY